MTTRLTARCACGAALPFETQVKSGQVVVPPFRTLSNGDDTYLLDYAVYARPDGAWWVNVHRTDGNVVTCNFAAGATSGGCEYIRSTGASGTGSALTWYGKLTLELSDVQGASSGGGGAGGGGSGGSSGGGSTSTGGGGGGGGSSVVPGSSVSSPQAGAPSAGGPPSAAPSAGSSGSGGGGGGSGATVGGKVSVALVWVAALLAACLAMQPW